MKTWLLVGGVILSTTAIPVGAAAQQAAEGPLARSLTVEQKAVYAVVPPPSLETVADDGLEVLAWVNRPDYTYASGEDVHVFVETNKDAYVTVLNVDPAGETTVLFPNEHQPDNFVAGGRALRVPDPNATFRIVVSGTVGTELLKVIASTEPRPLFEAQQLAEAGPFQVVQARPARLARSLTVVMAGGGGGTQSSSSAQTGSSGQSRPSAQGGSTTATPILASSSNDWAVCHQAINTVSTLSASARRTRSLIVQRTEARPSSARCEEAR